MSDDYWTLGLIFAQVSVFCRWKLQYVQSVFAVGQLVKLYEKWSFQVHKDEQQKIIIYISYLSIRR